MQYNIQLVDVQDIKAGDIIICEDGNMRTVCKKDIKVDSFMGLCIFGNSYSAGHKKVKKVVDLKY